MVHALEIIWRLLRPSGRLVDIHPTGEPPSALAIIAGKPHFLGYVQETDDFVEYAQADAALNQAERYGWFLCERKSEFVFSTRAGSMDELRAFLSDTWSDAILAPEMDAMADGLRKDFSEVPDHDFVIEIREKIHIQRFRRGNRKTDYYKGESNGS